MSLPDTVQPPLGFTRFWTTKMLDERAKSKEEKIEERETGSRINTSNIEKIFT